MISVSEATKRVLNHQVNFGIESLPIRKVYGRVLAEDLLADRDFPPFTRVAMDGIAISFDQFSQGRRIFPIQEVVAAGAPQAVLQNPAHCLEVMTGAMLPENTDTVIRYEDLKVSDGYAQIIVEHIKQGQNAHLKGSDRCRGDLIVPANRIIGPGEIGIAATVGKAHLWVRQLPKTLIVYTGDELVDVAAIPLPHQIRASNVFTLDALLSNWKISADILHLKDAKTKIHQKLKESLETYDLIMLSGGISKGKFDFIPEVLDQLGVQNQFNKVLQRPGKPFWFGYTEKTTVFAFPGNPVSAFMCARRYLIPWLRQNLGLTAFVPAFATLTNDFHNKSNLNYFLAVKVKISSDGRLLATPQTGHGSGDLANLTDADGFIELPPGPATFRIGNVFPLFIYR